MGKPYVPISVRQTSLRPRWTELRNLEFAAWRGEGRRRPDNQAGRSQPETGQRLWLLVRLRRRLVSSGQCGPDRASHPDRRLPAHHQAGGQVSAAVSRRRVRTVFTKGYSDWDSPGGAGGLPTSVPGLGPTGGQVTRTTLPPPA